MEQQKQPDWLKVAVMTTIIGGVVQVIVNHFDNLLALLGGAISNIHLPVSLSITLNIVSALATIGGATATVLAYRYRRDAKKLRSVMIKVHNLLIEAVEQHEKQAKAPPAAIDWDEVARQFAKETAADPTQISEQSRKP